MTMGKLMTLESLSLLREILITAAGHAEPPDFQKGCRREAFPGCHKLCEFVHAD